MDRGTGVITTPILGLERLVAESTAFQRRRKVSNDVEARKHIHLFDYEDHPNTLKRARPFAAIWPADPVILSTIAGGTRNWMIAAGDLVLILTDNDNFPGRDNRRRSGLDFAGFVEGVIRDVRNNAGRDDRLNVRGLETILFAHSASRDAPSGEFWEAAFQVHWGMGR